MPGRSIRIARISGIPVGISPWWFAIVALLTWSLGSGYYPSEVHGIAPLAAYALALASVLLLFASILAHEFGHALVARRRGIEVEEIDLWLLGGVSRMSGRPHTAGDELSFALAGPAVTAVVTLVFGVVLLVLPSSAPNALHAILVYQTEVNALVLGFNLVPAFPLDGGRVARALLWRHTGDITRATETAARMGRGFGYLLIAFGFLLTVEGAVGGLWFAVIGAFVVIAAGAERVQEQVLATFAGVAVSDLMSHPVVTIPAGLTLEDAQRYFERYRFTSFPVVDGAGRAIGQLGIEQLERTPFRQWAGTSVEELANRDRRLLIKPGTDVAELLEEPAFERFGRAVVIDEEGRPLGVLSVVDVQRALRGARLGESTRRSTRKPRHA